MQNEYQGFIFTKHALERLALRHITQDQVVQVLRNPDNTQPTGKGNTTKFIRTLNDRMIQVVGTYLAEQHKWLIVSVWVRGEDDEAPLMWRIITLPFRAAWWLIKKAYHQVTK